MCESSVQKGNENGNYLISSFQTECGEQSKMTTTARTPRLKHTDSMDIVSDTPMSKEAGLFRVEEPEGRRFAAIRNISRRTLIHVAHCIPISKAKYDNQMQFTAMEHNLFNDS